MTSPDTAIFIAQAAPWSPATNGVVNAPAVWANIKEEKDFDKYKGKLAGKVVFLGEMREVKPMDKPLFIRRDENNLKSVSEYPAETRTRPLSEASEEACVPGEGSNRGRSDTWKKYLRAILNPRWRKQETPRMKSFG